jgi:hypothetical protein
MMVGETPVKKRETEQKRKERLLKHVGNDECACVCVNAKDAYTLLNLRRPHST